MDKDQNSREGCLVCGTDAPEQAWVDETYEAQPCRFCSPHCQAKFEAEPEPYAPEIKTLVRPLGYS